MPMPLEGILTRHARARMQQRGIPAAAIDHVLRYGRERHDGHGCVVVCLDRSARRRIERKGTARGAALDRLEGVYVVLTTDGTVRTVGHRYRRLKN